MPSKTTEKTTSETQKKSKASLHAHEHDHKLMMDYMINAKWYSWESPIGLSIFFLGLCLCFMVLAYTVVLLKTTGLF